MPVGAGERATGVYLTACGACICVIGNVRAGCVAWPALRPAAQRLSTVAAFANRALTVTDGRKTDYQSAGCSSCKAGLQERSADNTPTPNEPRPDPANASGQPTRGGCVPRNTGAAGSTWFFGTVFLCERNGGRVGGGARAGGERYWIPPPTRTPLVCKKWCPKYHVRPDGSPVLSWSTLRRCMGWLAGRRRGGGGNVGVG